MEIWKTSSPYGFSGYYLKAPCHGNASWSGSRAKLTAMGWGLAVIYVGRQVQGPCSESPITLDLGIRDGKDAVAKTAAEGFARNTVVYLDIEAMDVVTDAVKEYARAWFGQVLEGGFVPGMYCHVRNAAELRSAALAGYPQGAPEPIFWVAGGKKPFDPTQSRPADSGVDFAGLWQGKLDTTETHGGVKINIDIDVSSFQNPSGIYVTAPSPEADTAFAAVPLAPPPTSLEQVNCIIQRNLKLFEAPYIVGVRAGYQVVAGQPTGRVAIVVKSMNHDTESPAHKLPDRVEGVPVDVRQASVVEQLRVLNPAAAAALENRPEFEEPDWEFSFGPAAAMEMDVTAAGVLPTIPYVPADVPLDPVETAMTINCHISPDAGWSNLKPFLEATQKTLTVGMYDFGADHIATTFQTAIKGKELTMVLDSNPAGPDEHPLRMSLAQELGSNLKFAWAAEGTSHDVTSKIFPNAYHIKVAVRDSRSMWLSSGNWMESNQPDIDPLHKPSDRAAASKRNREWHVILDHPPMAVLYEKYLQQDFKQASAVQKSAVGETAEADVARLAEPEFFVESISDMFEADDARPPRRFFAPLVLSNETVRIQPLLTPDNYGPHILSLIRSATRSFYMQTQYIHASTSSPAVLKSLVNAVQERINQGVDVRLIVHEREASTDWAEKLREMGFQTSVIRLQPGIHNKGMVIDSKIAVVGSQNWSGDGVARNRDASLILFNEKIAKYFEEIFLHDWTTLARPFVHKTPRVLVAQPGQDPPPGFRRVTISELIEED